MRQPLMITSVPAAATPSRSFRGEDATNSSLTAPPRRAMVHHEGSPLSVPVPGTSFDYGSINSTGYTLFSLPSCSEDRSHFDAPYPVRPVRSPQTGTVLDVLRNPLAPAKTIGFRLDVRRCYSRRSRAWPKAAARDIYSRGRWSGGIQPVDCFATEMQSRNLQPVHLRANLREQRTTRAPKPSVYMIRCLHIAEPLRTLSQGSHDETGWRSECE
jgi:hypothetical protein